MWCVSLRRAERQEEGWGCGRGWVRGGGGVHRGTQLQNQHPRERKEQGGGVPQLHAAGAGPCGAWSSNDEKSLHRNSSTVQQFNRKTNPPNLVPLVSLVSLVVFCTSEVLYACVVDSTSLGRRGICLARYHCFKHAPLLGKSMNEQNKNQENCSTTRAVVLPPPFPTRTLFLERRTR